MEKMPFHYGLFYNAMVGLISREPDFRYRMGWDGYYEFHYKPKNNKEVNKLKEAAQALGQWLDDFDIKFSESVCQYGIDPARPEEKEMLYIRISHPVTKKGEILEEIEKGIRKKKIVALEKDKATGEVTVHTFDDDRSLLSAYFAGADTPEKYASTPKVLFISELYEPAHINQI